MPRDLLSPPRSSLLPNRNSANGVKERCGTQVVPEESATRACRTALALRASLRAGPPARVPQSPAVRSPGVAQARPAPVIRGARAARHWRPMLPPRQRSLSRRLLPQSPKASRRASPRTWLHQRRDTLFVAGVRRPAHPPTRQQSWTAAALCRFLLRQHHSFHKSSVTLPHENTLLPCRQQLARRGHRAYNL